MSRIISPLGLGYGILAGPILWAIHFTVVYLFAEFGCRANFTNLVYFSPETLRMVIIVVTVIALVGIGAGEVVAYRSWGSVQASDAEPPQRMQIQFLALMGILLSALFILGVITTVVPTFFLDTCGRAL